MPTCPARPAHLLRWRAAIALTVLAVACTATPQPGPTGQPTAATPTAATATPATPSAAASSVPAAPTPLPTVTDADLTVDPDRLTQLLTGSVVTVTGPVPTDLPATMPQITAPTPSGRAVTFPAAGRPTLIGLVAHWCDHCAAELADIADIARPDAVDVVLVLTANQPADPTWPATRLLTDAAVRNVTVVVDDGTIAAAVALQATPTWLLVDRDLQLGTRIDQQVGADTYAALLAGMAR